MKRIKSYSILFIAAATVAVSLISFSTSTTVKAIDQNSTYDESWGNHATANMKNFVYPLAYCSINWGSIAASGWNINLVTGKISPKTISEGKWFRGIAGSYMVSPTVEKAVGGKFDDSKINCDEKDSAIVSSTIEAVNNVEGKSITGVDLICNKFDNPMYNGGGLLGRGNMNTECGLIYGNDKDDNHYYYDNKTSDEKSNYIMQLLGDQVYFPSTLEYYFLIYDAFTTACSGGKSSGDSGTYLIKELSNNEVVEAWYTGNNKPGPDDTVVYFGTDVNVQSMTCRSMEKALHGDEGEYELALEAYARYLKESGTTDPGSGSDGDEGKVEKNCQNQGGAGALGWIVCSILDWMQRTTENMYNDVVEPALRVESKFFESDDTFRAWETFRDISNIIFIILLLIVIFSQVTGVGIDNYGIKKILPKLIVAAVLVNLSYWICLICVDISNILGAGFQDFFNDLSSGKTADIAYSGESGGSVAMDTGIVAVGVVGAAVGIIAIVQNPALLLTLFVAVLGVLIAVLFIFILLAGRKAAIVLLTVFSPIAFVLYLLPNTKKLFDKWLKLWESMLLLYPIAGLLIGGGNFASGLMLSVSDGIVPIFTAMVIGIIPIFFIPTVLKGAFSAMGSIGGMISGAGNRLRSGATRRMRNSNAYKNAQQMGLDRKNRIKSGLNSKGELTGIGRLRHKVAGSKPGQWIGADRRLNARTKAARKTMNEQEEASATSMELLAASEMGDTDWVKAVDGGGNLTGNNLFSGRRENYYASKFTKAAENGDRKSMNAALAAAKSAGVKDKDIAKMVRHAANSGALSGKDKQGNDDPQMNLWLQSQASTNKALAKDVELQDWAATGGTRDLKGYGDYAEKYMKPSDLDKGKISNASTESLAGLAKAGKLQPDAAREVLQDNSAQLSPDKRIILGAVRDGQIVTSGATVDGIIKDAETLSVGDPIASGGTGINSNVTATYANENWVAPPPKRVEIISPPTPPTP